MITPEAMQICAVKTKGRDEFDYAIWDTNYSIYGAGGHFRFAEGGMAGLPLDVEEWFGTHWTATETPGIAINGQTGQKDTTA